MRKGNVTKYIQKLKENNLAALVVGQNNGLGLKEVYHPGKYSINNMYSIINKNWF